MRKHYTAEQRTALIEMVVTGRAKLRKAAEQLGVSESAAYYWVKCAKQRSTHALVPGEKRRRRSSGEKVDAPTFARLVTTTTARSAITLRAAGVVIDVQSGFDPVLLREVVSALMERTS